jgi:hypothetical protein
MGDFTALVMTGADEPPSHNLLVFVASLIPAIVLFAVVFFTVIGVVERRARRTRALAQTVPAEPAIETLEVAAP